MSATPKLDPRRWKALLFIALAQLMIVLDATVVNIAMPSAQLDLGMSDNDRQWIITAYTLAFGGLLLLGGRVADLAGRKRALIAGLAGFAVASAIGGAAVNGEMLVAARALQGAFGALLAPSALALVTVTFTEPGERAKAFGIYSAVAGSGGAIGLLLGGALTQYLSWRWALYLSVPVAIIAGAGSMAMVCEPAQGRVSGGLDIPGALLSAAGLVLLVTAFASTESGGWTADGTAGLLIAALVLLAAFLLVEAKVRAPLLPLRVIAERNRGGVYLALLLAVISMFGLYLFLTYYLQIVKGFNPVVTGLAFLPMVVGLVIGSTQIAGRLLPRLAPRLLMGWGLAVAAVGMLLLTRLRVDSGYASLVMPAVSLQGLGLGPAFVPAISLATAGVEPSDAGVASAMVTAVQQVGGAIGTVMLNVIAAGASTDYVNARPASAMTPRMLEVLQRQAMVHGFTRAIWWTVAALVLATVITFIFVNGGINV